MKKTLSSRKDWIDMLRAMAMFFVILGHQLKGKKTFFVFTSPVKIPMFFMITGYVFNYNRKEVSTFFRNMFFKLIVPWLCLTVPFVIIKAVAKGDYSIIVSGIYEIISGKSFWYMPCLVVAEIIWFFIIKFGKKPLYISVTATVIAILGLVAASYNVLDFAMINRAMVAQFYILLGFLFKRYEEKIFKMHLWHIALMFIVYIAMALISLKIWPNVCLDVHRSFYYNYPYCFAMIVLGCMSSFAAAHKLRTKVPRIIQFLGQNTLVYYMLCSCNTSILKAVILKLNMQMSQPVGIALNIVFAYIMCGIEALLLNRFFPVIVGKKKVQSKG